MSILEVRDVSIIYSDDKRVAVEHASFKIEAGEYACIIGSNGSGKSTLVKGIVGLVPVTSGEVIHALSPEQYAYLSQITEVERDFPATVREVVLAGMQRSGRRFPFYTREDRKKAADAMETLDITDLADYRIGNLSGGQKQRVLLARALCREPKLLILDEPCAGLDPAITAEFYSLIDHIKRLNTLCNENPQWENYLLEIGGSDALLQDRHEKEYILNEFIPYLNLHVTLSEIEQSVSEKLGETDELTLERSEQFAALQQNVRTVRAMLNQGNYDFSVAQINELSPKFAEWMRQISKKSIQQSSENTLTKEEIIHDFEQIATQNRAEIRQEQHEEFEITML